MFLSMLNSMLSKQFCLQLILHGKKSSVHPLRKLSVNIAKCGILRRSLAFSDCKIRGFPFVFLTVNSSFRSIIRQFSTTVNSRKTSGFTGVHRTVNALKTDCFPLFSRRFPVTKQSVNWCLREFSLIYLMFTARLTYGIQVVFQCFLVFPSYKTTHSLEFSVTFLAFSRTVNARKMPENRLFFSVHQLVNT